MRVDAFLDTEAVNACALIAANGWLGVLDGQSNLHYLRQGRSVALQKFSSPLPHKSYAGNCASDDGSQLCLWLENKARHYLLTYNEAKRGYGAPRAVVGLQKAAGVGAFSSDNTLLALGDDEGRLWVIHTASGKPLWQLPKCADAISSVCFNAAATLVAYGSFMRDMTIYDLNADRTLRRFTHSKDYPVILTRFFNTKPFLLLGTRHHEIALYDIDNKRSRSLPTRLKEWPTAAWIEPGDGFALIGDRSGALYLAALDEREGDVSHLADLGSPIVDIRMQEGVITLLLSNGQLAQLHHEAHLATLSTLLEAEDGRGAVELGKQYPPARHSRVYSGIKKLFDKAAKKAITAIAKNNLEKAQAFLAPFAQEPRFSQPIGSLAAFTPKIRAFSEAVELGRTDQAYAMVLTNGFYKKLEEYRELEKKFMVQFRAAALLLTGKRPDAIGAKRMVEEFSKIPAKAKILQALFEMPLLFKTAEDILKNNDFEAFQRLSEKYEILKEAPFYARYEEEADAAIELFESLYDADRPGEALTQSETITRLFTPFLSRIDDLVKSAQIRRAFEEAWREKNYLTALSYAQRHPDLFAHPHYAALMRFFGHRLNAAAAHAFALEFEPMHAICAPLLKNRYFKERALVVYQAYYLEELSRIAQTLAVHEWPGVLKRFVERFGSSSLLSVLAARFGHQETLAAALVYQERGFTQKPLITSLTAAGL